MLIGALDEHADVPLLVSSHAGTVTRGEVRDRAEALVAEIGHALSGCAIGIRGRPTFENIAWLAASIRLGALAVVLPADRSADAAEGLDLAGIVGEGWSPRPDRAPEPDPGLVLFTSDTSRTEATRYEWPVLLAQVRAGVGVQGARWLLTEPMSSYGGMHVLIDAIIGRGTVCVPSPAEPGEQLDAAAAAGVTHVCGTPAFFRWALRAVPRRLDWIPRQITVGGGPVPPDLIDDLREHFPRTRLTHLRELRATVSRRGSRW